MSGCITKSSRIPACPSRCTRTHAYASQRAQCRAAMRLPVWFPGFLKQQRTMHIKQFQSMQGWPPRIMRSANRCSTVIMQLFGQARLTECSATRVGHSSVPMTVLQRVHA